MTDLEMKKGEKYTITASASNKYHTVDYFEARRVEHGDNVKQDH